MNVFQHKEYKEFLRDRFGERCAAISSYSLRRFAIDLGVSVSRLSEILNGPQGLSNRTAEKIATRLNLNPDESRMFGLLVAARNPKSSEMRRKAQLDAIKLRSERLAMIDVDQHHLIADWFILP